LRHARRGVTVERHRPRAFGDPLASDPKLREVGGSTARWRSVEDGYGPRSGIPRTSAIPVAVRGYAG
jgi:hypothetical protein